MKLGIILKQVLKQRDMTAAQLARATNISTRTIHNWLIGQTPRNLDQLFKVAKHLSVSVEYLCWGEPSKSEKPIDVMKQFSEDEIFAGNFEVILRRIKNEKKE
ncbi:MAG: hypothetical protein A4S09_04885 [Proteobacteria bacterium SG_bin7]|nr:MAG: hypothetical protein A4S09_04885 [Proteobacteria bacterium SG_bin7]